MPRPPPPNSPRSPGSSSTSASSGAGVYGEHRGQGPAGYFKGDLVVTGHIQFAGADCAERFDVSEPDRSAHRSNPAPSW